MKKIILALLLLPLTSLADVCSTLSSGDWTDVSNWSCGHLPAGGDTIIINAGHTIGGISSNLEITGDSVYLDVYGTLDFGNSGKLTIPSGSEVIVQSSALIKKGNGSGSNNVITIGTVDVWTAADGNLSGYFYLSENCTVSSPCIPLNYGHIDFSISHQNCVQINYHIITEYEIENISIFKSNGDNWDTITITDNLGIIDDCYLDDINYYYYITSTLKNKREIRSVTKYISLIENKLKFDSYFDFSTVKNISNKKLDLTIYNLLGSILIQKTLDRGEEFNLFKMNSPIIIQVYDGQNIYFFKKVY